MCVYTYIYIHTKALTSDENSSGVTCVYVCCHPWCVCVRARVYVCGTAYTAAVRRDAGHRDQLRYNRFLFRGNVL